MDGRNVTDNNEIAQSMNDFFCSEVKSLVTIYCTSLTPCFRMNITSMKKVRVSSSVSVEKALKKMKTSFGFGSDGIANHFIKIAFPIISYSLCRIYNLSIESGIFPDSWKIARVAPIFKVDQLRIDPITDRSLS